MNHLQMNQLGEHLRIDGYGDSRYNLPQQYNHPRPQGQYDLARPPASQAYNLNQSTGNLPYQLDSQRPQGQSRRPIWQRVFGRQTTQNREQSATALQRQSNDKVRNWVQGVNPRQAQSVRPASPRRNMTYTQPLFMNSNRSRSPHRAPSPRPYRQPTTLGRGLLGGFFSNNIPRYQPRQNRYQPPLSAQQRPTVVPPSLPNGYNQNLTREKNRIQVEEERRVKEQAKEARRRDRIQRRDERNRTRDIQSSQAIGANTESRQPVQRGRSQGMVSTWVRGLGKSRQIPAVHNGEAGRDEGRSKGKEKERKKWKDRLYS
jgi:hypothetical protein